MLFWIRRFAFIFGMVVWAVVFAAGLNPHDPFDAAGMTGAFVKAVGAGFLFWMAGFLTADIIFKGVIESVTDREIPLHEGGLLQRARERKEQEDPDRIVLDKTLPDSPGDNKKKKKKGT